MSKNSLCPLWVTGTCSKLKNATRQETSFGCSKKAGIKLPRAFKSPEEIDCLAIVKVPEKERAIERAFFYASTLKSTSEKLEKRIKAGIITQEALEQAVIEEYVIGAKFNANYFWSPLNDEIDLLGFDRRIQTDLDGVLDLPAARTT